MILHVLCEELEVSLEVGVYLVYLQCLESRDKDFFEGVVKRSFDFLF